MLHTTLLFLRDGDKILLGLKKRGFGEGRLNGVGGKVEKDESFIDAAIRETREEIGVDVTKMTHVGEIVFEDLYYKGVPERNLMHVFVASEWSGEPVETDEIKPIWVNVNEIPYDKMWGDDAHWLPHVLAGETIEAWFHYNEHNEFTDFWVKQDNPEVIVEIDDSYFGGKADGDIAKFSIKYASRAVLINEQGQVAMIHSVNRGWYKLPGGRREDGELPLENLEREVLEEAGYEVEVLEDLGRTRTVRHQWEFIGETQTYLCRTKKFIGRQPMDDEIEDGDTLEWFDTVDDALAALNAVDLDKINFYGARFFVPREIETLKCTKPLIEEKYGRR